MKNLDSPRQFERLEGLLSGTPSVTIRDVTELPETMECGSTILAGAVPEMLAGGMKVALKGSATSQVPEEYQRRTVATIE